MYEKTYHARVLKQDADTGKKEKRSFSWKRFFVVVGIVVALFLFGYALKYPKLQVITVTVSGVSVLDTDEVASVVRSSLEGRWLWIFPKTSTILVRPTHIEALLKKEFSRIETVSVERVGGHSIGVTLSEYAPRYLWCTDTQECYFMDEQGAVYSPAPVFSGTAYPKVFTGAPLATLPFAGMTKEGLAQIEQLQVQLSDINIVPVAFHYLSPHEMRVDFLHNKTIAEFLLDPTVPTDTSLEYLFSGIRTEPLVSLFHNPDKKLLYIDVRFSGKVLYKFE